MKQRILVVALLCASALALVWHSLVWNFVTDDAFISFVYARNLADAGQLVFNLGERVEGYTNFLWTVLLAGFMKVGLLPELMSRVLGTAFAIGSFFVSARLVAKLRRGEPSAWDAVPAIFLCASTGYACWASGGLETQMFTFFVTLGAARYLTLTFEDRAPDVWVGVAFGLAALTRPEGILFFALTALHRAAMLVVARRWLPTRGDILAGLAFLVLVAPHLMWRHAYYGYWLPNTFYIKASGGAGTWSRGGYYLYRMALALEVWAVVPVLVLALVLSWRDRALRLLAGYVVFLTAAFYFYIASVGGDFMGLFRFALPVLPLICVVLAFSLRAIDLRRAGAGVALAGALFLAHVGHAIPVTHKAQEVGADQGIDTPGFLRWYTADRTAIGKWFGAHREAGDYANVGGAGAQVYYSRIPSLDCFGLSDAYIAHKVAASTNRPGHQKYAPLSYELSKHPTIITSGYYKCCSAQLGDAPYRPSPNEVSEWRQRGYRYVTARIDGLSYPYYSFLLRNDRHMSDLVVDPLREASPADRSP
jgi:hypothetical protein